MLGLVGGINEGAELFLCGTFSVQLFNNAHSYLSYWELETVWSSCNFEKKVLAWDTQNLLFTMCATCLYHELFMPNKQIFLQTLMPSYSVATTSANYLKVEKDDFFKDKHPKACVCYRSVPDPVCDHPAGGGPPPEPNRGGHRAEAPEGHHHGVVGHTPLPGRAGHCLLCRVVHGWLILQCHHSLVSLLFLQFIPSEYTQKYNLKKKGALCPGCERELSCCQ